MKTAFLYIFLFLVSTNSIKAQSYAYGVKVGPSMAFQQWDAVQRSPLFKYHAVAFIESVDDGRFNLYAQTGYHIRGSALRNRRVFSSSSGNLFDLPTQEYIFNNISLSLGAKSHQWKVINGGSFYYGFAIRGEYTFDTNFDEFPVFEDANGRPLISSFPVDEFVRKFTYGMSFTGGMEFPFSDYVAGILEFTVSPDLSRQYQQPAFENVYDPYTGAQRRISEQSVTNVSLEVSLGIRFLREIIYVY